MEIQLINFNANIKQLFWIISGIWLAVMAYSASAKQSTFTYDAAGNTVAIAGTGGTAPAITAPPQTRLLEPNRSVSFSVAATGLGNASQWLCNSVLIFNGGSKAAGYISEVIEG